MLYHVVVVDLLAMSTPSGSLLLVCVRVTKTFGDSSVESYIGNCSCRDTSVESYAGNCSCRDSCVEGYIGNCSCRDSSVESYIGNKNLSVPDA